MENAKLDTARLGKIGILLGSLTILIVILFLISISYQFVGWTNIFNTSMFLITLWEILVFLVIIFGIIAIILGAIGYFRRKESIIGKCAVVFGAIALVTIILVALLTHGTGRFSVPHSENAFVDVNVEEGFIHVTLIQEGGNYDDGYTSDQYQIYINGTLVEGDAGNWIIGEDIVIGTNDTGYEFDGDVFSTGEYRVTVVIVDTVIYYGYIEII